MAWLRIDDGFAEHPKLLELALADRWAWLEVLCYCARNGTDGRIPNGIGEAVKRATPALLGRAEKAGLVDRDEDGARHVHDWDIYNGSLENRVADYLSANPDASANEVVRAVGGKRNVVLALVADHRNRYPGNQNGNQNPGTQGTTKPVPGAVPGEPKREPKSGTQSGTRARAPQPLEDQEQDQDQDQEQEQAGRQAGPRGDQHTPLPTLELATIDSQIGEPPTCLPTRKISPHQDPVIAAGITRTPPR